MKITERKYWNLLREMTLAQFKVKDQSTSFGFLWSFLNPLLVLCLLYIVFRPAMGQEINHYSAYLLIGIVHYTHFSNTTTAAMQILLARVHLTRDTIFPKEILVIAAVAANTIDFVFSMLICTVLALCSGVRLTTALVGLPFILALQLLLVLWVSLLLSALYVYIRDLTHVYQVFLRLLFFTTPIFYSLSSLGDGVGKYVVLANPLTYAVECSRSLIIEGRLFDMKIFFVLSMLNALLVRAAYTVFKRLEPTFAENA